MDWLVYIKDSNFKGLGCFKQSKNAKNKYISRMAKTLKFERPGPQEFMVLLFRGHTWSRLSSTNSSCLGISGQNSRLLEEPDGSNWSQRSIPGCFSWIWRSNFYSSNPATESRAVPKKKESSWAWCSPQEMTAARAQAGHLVRESSVGGCIEDGGIKVPKVTVA